MDEYIKQLKLITGIVDSEFGIPALRPRRGKEKPKAQAPQMCSQCGNPKSQYAHGDLCLRCENGNSKQRVVVISNSFMSSSRDAVGKQNPDWHRRRASAKRRKKKKSA